MATTTAIKKNLYAAPTDISSELRGELANEVGAAGASLDSGAGGTHCPCRTQTLYTEGCAACLSTCRSCTCAGSAGEGVDTADSMQVAVHFTPGSTSVSSPDTPAQVVT